MIPPLEPSAIPRAERPRAREAWTAHASALGTIAGSASAGAGSPETASDPQSGALDAEDEGVALSLSATALRLQLANVESMQAAPSVPASTPAPAPESATTDLRATSSDPPGTSALASAYRAPTSAPLGQHVRLRA